MKNLEEGLFELRDGFNSVFGEHEIDCQSPDISPAPGSIHRPAAVILGHTAEEADLPLIADVDGEDELQPASSATAVEEPVLHIEEARARWHAVNADAPMLLHSPAAAALDEQFAIDERDLAKRFDIAE